MAEPLPSAICEDMVTTLKAALPELQNRIVYGPPENTPVSLCVWLDYGPVEIEWGLMEVCLHTITATVAVGRNGNYPGEYQTVTDYAQLVKKAMYGNYVLADEAIIVGVSVNRATGSAYAGQQDALVAATVIFTVETKADNRAIAQE